MFKISPINFNNIYKSPIPFKGIYESSKSDTFIKTSTDKRSNDFINWAEKNNFLKDGLQKIITDSDNLLGKGFTHCAYSIPNNDEYILRMRNFNLSELDFNTAEISDTEDKELGVNIGQEVAQINIKTKGKYPFPFTIEVLKRQSGTSIGVPPYQAIYIEDTDKLRDGEKPYEDISRKEKYAQNLHQIAQLPIGAFEQLIDTIQKAEAKGYILDHLNSNNLMIDSKNKSINPIDMEKRNTKADFGNVLYALINIYYFDTFTSKYDHNPMPDDKINQVCKDTLDIIEKYTQAMKNKGVKFDKNNCSMEFFNFIMSTPCSFFCKTFNLQEKWEKLAQMGLV